MLVSPLFGQCCRFSPTCSAYMIEAIREYGVIKGILMGMVRIMKCHPYYKGDYIDPVRKSSKEQTNKNVK